MIRPRPSPSLWARRISRCRSCEAESGLGIGALVEHHGLMPGAAERPCGREAHHARADDDHPHPTHSPDAIPTRWRRDCNQALRESVVLPGPPAIKPSAPRRQEQQFGVPGKSERRRRARIHHPDRRGRGAPARGRHPAPVHRACGRPGGADRGDPHGLAAAGGRPGVRYPVSGHGRGGGQGPAPRATRRGRGRRPP